jgi:hypothetical protein
LSLKENIDMVREELSQEEKLFAGAVRTERFVKKYKMPIISALTTIVIMIIGYSLYQMNVARAVASSNEAYIALLNDPQDKAAQEILKENNTALFDAWQFKRALDQQDEALLQTLSSSSSDVISDLSRYELAALKKDKSTLNAYALEQASILKDLALLNEAVLLMKEKKTEEAKARLRLIDEKSSLNKIATLLQHYGVQ